MRRAFPPVVEYSSLTLSHNLLVNVAGPNMGLSSETQ